LRLLCVHEAIADAVIEMVAGAARELVCGDPGRLATDVGPVIDADAAAGLQRHLARLRTEAKPLFQCALPARRTAAPGAAAGFEVRAIADVRQEVFGPVLHVVRWGGDPLAVIDAHQRAGLRPDAGHPDAHRQPRRGHGCTRARRQYLRQPQHDRRGGRRAAVRRRRPVGHRPQGRRPAACSWRWPGATARWSASS
jgi:hypothetical protein